MLSPVDLGFLEPCEQEWLLTSPFFRSKVGGRPAWLELKNLPGPKELLCDECGEPCIFLCQVYAPLEDKDSCFHRTIFVFVCLKASCYQPNVNKNIKVFRSQLPRRNDYYDFNPPNEDQPPAAPAKPLSVSGHPPLCVVCGCRGPQQCSQCRKVNYCGVVHQRIDWKNGHKAGCGKVEGTSSADILFPQQEIITEAEEIEPEEKLSEAENEKKQMEEYEKLMKEGKTGELSELSESELDKYSEQIEDKQFDKFKKIISSYPEQVLRYDRKSKPLWISNIVPKEIPVCELCGRQRVFEFQIMPQLLISLNNENIDWGVLAIYTCVESCDTPDRSYAKEFVYKQDVIQTEPTAVEKPASSSS
ncbi:programmed cell death protein 2 [Uranotaenia lowii]|uniref:programmed cell death protein 2 n=1 Tax=Uranotaenia lowii TaxID=190385 RepID=UPI002479E070|nr:programmed cell death protein 2 [Uranotaenia lowii]